MAHRGRCSGCDFEDAPRLVVKHHRSCSGFAELYRTCPEDALRDPVEVHRAAHSVETQSLDEKSFSRRTMKKSVVVGPVVVEYWVWHPTILEELQSSS